jgi:hypothetical protein
LKLILVLEQEKLEQKEKKAEVKHEAKAKKEEERTIKAEQKKLAQAEITRSAEHEQNAREEPASREDMVTVNSSDQPVSASHLSTEEAQRMTRSEESEGSPVSPRNKSPPGRVKTWFKSRFSRGPKSPDEEQKKEKPSERGFIGGASLTGIQGNDSSVSLDNRSRSASVRAVALAGRNSGSHHPRQDGDPEAVSPLSSDSGDEDFGNEVIDHPITHLTPPRPIRDSASAKSCSPTRDSRFREIL